MKKKIFLSVVIIAIVMFVVCLHLAANKEHHNGVVIASETPCETSYQSENNHFSSSDENEQEQIMYELARLENNDQQVIYHLGYTVSFSSNWNIPYWVAYELDADETEGEAVRAKSFTPDPEVQGVTITHKDYTNSGYDRGHMAPAADMKWSEQAMKESFYTSNICPQHHNLNNGDWKALEEHSRDLAKEHGVIFIACGPIVEDNHSTIGLNNNIVVPDSFYKVLLRQKDDGNWTAIGFVFPNEAGTKKNPLMTYIRTVNEIEQITGIDFFYQLPDSIEDIIESTFTIADWSIK